MDAFCPYDSVCGVHYLEFIIFFCCMHCKQILWHCMYHIDASRRPHHLCMIVYHFPPSFVPTIASHGNSKDKKPFFPTWPSTRDLVKSQCLKMGPKDTIQHVTEEVGGVLQAIGPGQLPRSERQVTNIIRREKLKSRCANSSNEADDLFVIMQRAHSEDSSAQFIRAIRAAPDPAIVLADNNQLNDMVRFCTSSVTGSFCILTIDPTFSLGEFDVTPITYRHMLLETKRSGRHPIFMGPLLIHYRKTFDVYLFFASTLVGMSRELQGVRAFGTDGERPLADAFGHEFTFSQRLTCFIHVRRNVKEKCSNCNIPSNLTNKIMDDIFGSKVGDTFVEGLVDALDDSDFQVKLDTVITNWRSESVSSSADVEGFINWFNTNKLTVIRDTMLKPIREECGLGSPPEPFTTNASESINAMIKHKVHYQRNELPSFVDKMHDITREQQKEVEKAIICRGKYRLKEQYRFLEISESKWFHMSPEQRKKHLSRLQSLTVADHDSSQGGTASVTPSISALSVDVSAVAQQLTIPLKCLEGMWAKAKELIGTEGAIASAPGQPQEARMVLSYSGKAPHLVIPNKGGNFSCDSSCPNFKSMGLCSHSVAVAEINGQLAQFISAKKRKKSPNVTSLLTTSMPRGRGRKGGVAPRTRKAPQVATTRIEMNISNTTPSVTVAPQSASPHQPGYSDQGSYFSPSTAVVSPYTSVHSTYYGTQQPYPLSPQEFGYSSFHSPPYRPPAFVPQYQPTIPFTLGFITGNISSCFGCKSKYVKSPQPPADLCIKHKDWREFVSPSSGTPQSKFGNVYYHSKPECVWMRCSYFQPSDLTVPPEVAERLNSIHKQYLSAVFGLQL